MATRKADIGRARSGKHVSRRIKLALNAEALALVDQAAERSIESRSDWIRGKLAIAVADELKLEPEKMIALFDELEG